MCVYVTLKTVDREVNAGATPVLLACLHPDAETSAQTAMLETIAAAYGPRVKVCLLREELSGAFKSAYAVEGTPTYLLLVERTVRERVLGQTDRQTLTRLLDRALDSNDR